MKQFVPLLCLAMLAAPLAPVSVSARDLSPLAVVEPAVVIQAAYGPRKGDRRDNDGRNNGNDNDGQRNGGNRSGGDGGFENRRDNRMSDAIAIASRRGDYINAWPEGGSMFRVRVSTAQGRKDIYVDMNCRCIVREE